MIKSDTCATKRSLQVVLLVLITAGLLSATVYVAEPAHPPVLSSPRVVPYNLNDRTRFQFEVRYESPDHNPPKTITAVVDGKELALRATSRTRYSAVYTSRSQRFEAGAHKYYFTCEDSKGLTDRNPRYGELTGPYVARSWRGFYNTYPQLAAGRVVQGEVGDQQTLFTYSVHFSDYDSISPRCVKVVIDGLDHPMKLHKGTGRNGLFVYNTYLDTGAHAYYFVAEDADHALVSYPAEGFLRGPNVGELPNTNPELTDATVDPAIGDVDQVYTFQVRYLDQEQDPPAIIQVFVDGQPHNMTLSRGSPYDGLYSYPTRLTKSNFHTFYFRAEDGRGGEVSMPLQGIVHGPVVVNLQ